MKSLIVRSAYVAAYSGSRHGACSVASSHLLLQRHGHISQSTLPIPSSSFRYASFRHVSTTGSSSQNPNPNNRQSPQIVTDRKYAIKGIVPSLDTTRPAPWDLPEAPSPTAYPNSRSLDPFQWDYQYLFRLGKAVGIFFKTGLKNIWSNYKTANDIRARLQRAHFRDPVSAALFATQPAECITYNEFQLLQRSRSDQWRLVPFFIVFCICGEFTPLVIPFLGSWMIPSTCTIPKQQANEMRKIFDRAEKARAEYAQLAQTAQTSPNQDKLSVRRAILTAYEFGLTSRPSYPDWIAGLLYNYRLQAKMVQRGNNVLASTALVLREGGFAKRSPEDLWEYANSAAIFTARKTAKENTVNRSIDPTLPNVATDHFKQVMVPILDREARRMMKSVSTKYGLQDAWTAVYDGLDNDARERDMKQWAAKSVPEDEPRMTKMTRQDTTTSSTPAQASPTRFKQKEDP